MARRLAAHLLGHADQIERDDLSLPENLATVAERERWPADKRNQDPLLFASYPDFVSFPPDGPLRQISIDQTRLLRDWAKLAPNQGQPPRIPDRPCRPRRRACRQRAAQDPGRTFAVPDPNHDRGERLRSAAHHSLARGAVSVRRRFRPKKRSLSCARAVWIMPERRAALSGGSPGLAVSLDLEAYDKRRAAMFTLLKVAAGVTPFGAWVPYSEAIGRTKSEKLELHLKVLYDLLAGRARFARIGRRSPQPGSAARSLRADGPQRSLSQWIRSAVKQSGRIGRVDPAQYPEIDRTGCVDRGSANLTGAAQGRLAAKRFPRSRKIPETRPKPPQRPGSTRFPIRAQRRDRERHSDAVIAEGIEFGRVEALRAREWSGRPAVSSSRTPMRRRFSTIVAMRSVSLMRSSPASRMVRPSSAGRAQHRQHRDLVDQRRGGFFLDRPTRAAGNSFTSSSPTNSPFGTPRP